MADMKINGIERVFTIGSKELITTENSPLGVKEREVLRRVLPLMPYSLPAQ